MKAWRAHTIRTVLALFVLHCISSLTWAQDNVATRIAPNGNLRVAVMVWNPALASRSADGKLSGVSIELANAFGAKFGVPVQLVPYQNLVHYERSLAKDEWDISFAPRNLSRSGILAFSDPLIDVTNGYVARAGLSLVAASKVDRRGIKIAVSQGSPLAGYLSRTLLHAKIIRLPIGASYARDALSFGRADVYADTMVEASRIAASLPGATVLVGQINTLHVSIVIPKKNAAVLPAVNGFVADAKQSGLIADAIKRANLRGVRQSR